MDRLVFNWSPGEMTSARAVAELCAEHGIPFVPYPERTSHSSVPGWGERAWGASDVPLKSNIGIILTDELVDLDLDCDEARKLADAFLPSTGFEFGEQSRSRAHRFYRASGMAYTKFKDPRTGGMLLEIRAKNNGQQFQTTAPGSIHRKTGAPIIFHRCDYIEAVSRTELASAAARLAAACLLLRAYPTQGHDYRLALCGWLMRGGFGEAESFVVTLTASSGNDANDARVAAKSTRERLANGETVAGRSKLHDFLTWEEINKCEEWLGLGEEQEDEEVLHGGSIMDLIREEFGIEMPLLEAPIPPPDFLFEVETKFGEFEGVIPMGKQGLLVGAGAAGKSLLAVQMGLCVASGTPLFRDGTNKGWNVGFQGDVLMFFAEENRIDILRRFKRFAQGLWNEAPTDLDDILRRIHVYPLEGIGVRLQDENGITKYFDTIKRIISERDFKLVLFDPLAQFGSPETEIDNAAASDFLRSIKSLHAETGATICITHHKNKQNVANDVSNQSAARGSSSLVDDSRFVLSLDRVIAADGKRDHPNLKRLALVKTNYAPPREEMLWTDKGGPFRVARQTEIDSIEEERNEYKREQKEKQRKAEV